VSFLLLCALVLVLADPAAAVDLVSGYRVVDVSTAPGPTLYEESLDLDPFDESVEIDLPPIEGGIHAIAAQTSSFSASEVVAAGSAFQEHWVSPYISPSTYSHLELFFDVSSPTTYELSGTLSAVSDDPAVGLSGMTVVLEEVGGSALVSLGGDCCFEATELDESGLLPPGSYRLEVEADIAQGGTVSFFRTATSSFDLTLSFAAPAIPALGPAGRGVIALVLALPAALVAARRLRPSR
jgi:hypothetical protein